MGLKEWTHNLCHSGDSLANVHYGLEPVNPVSPSLVAMLQFFHDDVEKYSLAGPGKHPMACRNTS